jgi:hypothetical protein
VFDLRLISLVISLASFELLVVNVPRGVNKLHLAVEFPFRPIAFDYTSISRREHSISMQDTVPHLTLELVAILHDKDAEPLRNPIFEHTGEDCAVIKLFLVLAMVIFIVFPSFWIMDIADVFEKLSVKCLWCLRVVFIVAHILIFCNVKCYNLG